MRKMNLVALMFAIVGLLTVGMVSATPNLDVVTIEINDHEVCEGDPIAAGDVCQADIDLYELNDELEIEIKVRAAGTDVDDITMFAYLAGYEYDDKESVSDSVHTFDLSADRTKWKTMNIKIPQNFDKDEYDLRIIVSERTGDSNEYRITLETEGPRHNIEIKGVVFTPEKVVAGRSLLSYVRLKNYGENDEDTLKVKVSIPDLDVSASEYVDELEEADSISSEELYIRIPKCAESGMYDVVVSVEFDEGYETESVTKEIEVVADESAMCGVEADAPKTQTIITVASETQDVKAGATSVIYPVTISNMGQVAKSYTIAVDGADFADFSVTPGNVVLLNPGEAKAVYVNVKAKAEANAGEQMFAISISSNGEVLKEIPLKANVVENEVVKQSSGWDKIKKGLEIGLVVLVVLLVLLGLIIGFNKMKGSDDDDDDEDGSQTYY